MWYDKQTDTLYESPRAFNKNETSYPEAVFRLWSLEELKAIQIYPVVDDPYPTDKNLCVMGYTLLEEVDRYRRVWTTQPQDNNFYYTLRLELLDKVKKTAEQVILEIMPFHKQINALRLKQNTINHYGENRSTWPDDVKTLVESHETLFAKIDDIRMQSDALEQQVMSLSNADMTSYIIPDYVV